MSSPSRTTTSTTNTTPTTHEPGGWNTTMTAFLLQWLDNGEDPKSAVILLETEFPAMRDKVSTAWIEELRKGSEGV
ncbi:MAG: hypothetical protein ALECFALPRED_003248 [Alectoria fallacina]|uniref:Uncharacterized protein n=1 Tax=Alectoria fallacina TaxID=1903189 RepID=A0A8H3FJW1_9LECA|nr:MAG: hypothetical protein ALECFALPRED_003248 [Alectoria fallacina]